jgi:hypothetical protein
MRPLLLVTGALATIAIFFFGTLFALDFYSPAHATNRLRAEHVKLLADALEKYHRARGAYPNLPGSPVDELKRELVDGGFLEAIPSDPARLSKGQEYLYVGGGDVYGVLVTLEPEPLLIGTKAAFTCVVGVHILGSGAWGDPSACPF